MFQVQYTEPTCINTSTKSRAQLPNRFIKPDAELRDDLPTHHRCPGNSRDVFTMKVLTFLALITTNQYASAFASPVIPLHEKVVIPLHEKVSPQPSLALGAHPERWSKQDIFTLIGVVITIVAVIIGLAGILVSSPKLRVWLLKRMKWVLRYPRRRSKHSSFIIQRGTKADSRKIMRFLDFCRQEIGLQISRAGRGKIIEKFVGSCKNATMSC
jgi:hypothetical protein